MITHSQDQSLCLHYLSQEDQTLITMLREQIQLRLDQGEGLTEELLNQTLRVLAQWRLPAQTMRAAMLAHTVEPKRLVEETGLIDEKTYQLAEDFRALIELSLERGEANYNYSNSKLYRINRLRQLFVTAYTNLELVLLCLAAHVANVNCINQLPSAKAHLLAEDNEIIFAPLAIMLGMGQLRHKLDDLSLERLHPKEWGWVKQIRLEQKKYYDHICNLLVPILAHHRITAAIPLRLHYTPAFRVYEKMRRGETLKELVREIKIDIMTISEADCYQVLQLIHQQWPPLEGRVAHNGSYFRDLIASPSYNGYRVLITTVGCHKLDDPKAKIPVKFHICTQAMDQTNAMGVVAAKFFSVPEVVMKNAWWNHPESLELIRTSPLGSSSEEIFVFSPIGEVYRLPQASTPIDYAYRVHSEVGRHCKRMWVNGQIAAYDQELYNGDLVEIEIDPRYDGPDKRWAEAVQTSVAKMNIKRVLKQRRLLPKGREIIDKILEQELEAYRLQPIPATDVDKFLKGVADQLNYPDLEIFYRDLVEQPQPPQGTLSPNRLVADLIARHLVSHIERADGQTLNIPKNRIRFAQCVHDKKLCRVTPQSEIVGRLSHPGSKYERLIVYKRDCPNAPSNKSAIPLRWREDMRGRETIRVTIHSIDAPRLLINLLLPIYALYHEGLYLLEIHAAQITRDRTARLELTLYTATERSVQLLQEELECLQQMGAIQYFDINALFPLQNSYPTELEYQPLAKSTSLPNLYSPAPARDRRVFKGREDEIRQIRTCLIEKQNYVVLYGFSRIGKTSLLHFLHDHHIATAYKFAPVLIDMQRLDTYSETGLWLEMANRINEAIAQLYGGKKRSLILPRLSAENDVFEAFQSWLEKAKSAVAAKGRILLIMIDELNEIDEAWDLNEARRAIIQLKSLAETERQLAFIFCTQESLYNQAMSFKTKVISQPLLKAGLPVRLDHLDRKAAISLIKEPIGQLLQYEADAVEKIIELTAGHPYFLQHLLHQLINHLRREGRRSVILKDIETIAPQLLTHGEHIFHYYLQEYQGVRRRAILSALAYLSGPDNQGVTLNELETTLKKGKFVFWSADLIERLEYFRNKGLVKRTQEAEQVKYYFRIPLLGRWLRENRPFYLVLPRLER